MTKTMLFAGAAIAGLILGGAGWLALNAQGGDRFAECRNTTLAISGDDIGGPFTLVSETGAEVTEAEVIDGLTIIYFGYTYCPDVCPLDAARNAEAAEIAAENGVEMKQIFITIDPERDTPEALA
ncbi:MAG: SCO family protein, partial [Pseudomonadota bacterium]